MTDTKQPQWTEKELQEFDRITWATGSPDQVARISARFDLEAFIKTHGKAKCDAMFEYLQATSLR